MANRKEAEVDWSGVRRKPTYGNVRQGFVYERVPHITLKSIANNAEIDVIWEEHQPKVEAAHWRRSTRRCVVTRHRSR